MRLDEIDQQIVASLVQDSRESYAAIGQKVGLSAPAVKRRVDVLQQTGAIKRFTAELDPSVMGWNIQAFVELHADADSRITWIDLTLDREAARTLQTTD